MNDHEDDASLSSKKDHHQLIKSDVDSAHHHQQAKLWVNIGISKDGKIQTFDGSQHENQMMMKITSGENHHHHHHHHIHDYGVRRRICQVCHKVFSSGKALGGHMRTHVVQQADKNNSNKLDLIDLNKKSQLLKVKRPNRQNPRDEHGARLIDFSTKKIQPKTFSRTNTDHVTSLPCVVCGKTFTSKNALFGHMRCHPEREWRGIKPPNSIDPTRSCSSSSSAAAEPSQKSPRDDDHKCVDLASSDINRAVDLSGSLTSWTVRRNRGTTLALGCNSSEISSKEDVPDYDSTMKECARHLLILSRGLSSDGGLIEKRNPAGESVAGNNLSEHTKFPDRANNLISKNKKGVSDSLSGFRINPPENKRTKAHRLELKGSDESNNGGGFVSDDSVIELDRHQDSVPTVSIIDYGEKRIRRVLDFDLNEEPPSEH